MIHFTTARRTILSDGNEIKITNLCSFVNSIITEFMVFQGFATDGVNRQRASDSTAQKMKFSIKDFLSKCDILLALYCWKKQINHCIQKIQ